MNQTIDYCKKYFSGHFNPKLGHYLSEYKSLAFQVMELKPRGKVTNQQASDRKQSFSLVNTVMTGNGLTHQPAHDEPLTVSTIQIFRGDTV